MPTSDGHPQQPSSDSPLAPGLPEITPDVVEQEHGDQLDNIIPTDGYGKIPVVGLGGSAGGLQALQAFFAAMPPDSGMAFVVIMHLSSEHESILAQLLQRVTTMPVTQVQGRVKVEANCVYVIPPGKHLSMSEGFLALTHSDRQTGRHVAVDLFFRTLADTQGPHSAAVVLSGADGDGAIGIKRVKERGGLTIAQRPDEAEHESMPRSAISTGMVDWVLPVAGMPAKLVEYWRAERRLQIPAELEGLPTGEDLTTPEKGSARAKVETTLHDILGFLRVRTGHDFTYYRRPTVLRRIARRMQVHGIEEPQEYLNFIRVHLDEPGLLLRDLLISVTNFFRDREAFAALEERIPGLFRDKGPGDSVRVWVPACATGEEAYSVAMLLHEHAAKLPHPPNIQVFATDLDEDAIQSARDGAYPETIAADVSEERLQRFFKKEHGGYRVRRELRENVLFALHDLLKDSPFSRLDLVSCRNLLIYLNRDAQARAQDIFYFSLLPDGLLILGSSESVDDESPLFAAVDKKRRLFVRGRVARVAPPLLSEYSVSLRAAMRQNAIINAHAIPEAPSVTTPRLPVPLLAAANAVPPDAWSELHYDFVERLAPPSVLVNGEYQVVHLSENAGRFLEFEGGNASMNLLNLVRPTLRMELRAALYRATETGEIVETHGLTLEIDGGLKSVRMRVLPARTTEAKFLLVVFDEQAAAPAAAPPPEPGSLAEPVMRQLEQELERTKWQLRQIIEQSDASTEELKAANEEFQAMNEELRSATEELETGREELQSVNEELNTVNQELKAKVDALGHANSDLQNLMAATQIATVFLDARLCIQRYTPPAVAIFNLISSDVGRPLEDLAPRLNYPELRADAARVLAELTVSEVEVSNSDGHCFLARMLPYRTVDNVIAGVVMTFVDITRRRKAEEDLRNSEARFRTVSNVVPDLLFSMDPEGRLLWCNERWLAYTGHTLAQVQGTGWVECVHPEDRARVRQDFLASVENGEPYHNEHRLLRADGQAHWFLARAEPSRDATGRITQWFGAKTDIDDFKRAQADLRVSEERFRTLIENAREFAIFSMDLDRRITSWNTGAERLLGFAEKEIIGQSGDAIFTPEDRAAGAPAQEAGQALAEGRAADERWHLRKDGSRFWGSGAMMAMHGPTGEKVGLMKILRDQTEARQTHEALERSRQELLTALRETEQARADAEAAGKAKDHFLAVLSHELRTPLTPVTMAAHLLSRRRDLPEEAREAVAMIQRNVQTETQMIDGLLDITRIARGKLEIVRAPMDLHEAVRRAVEISADDIQTKKQRLTVTLEAREHALEGDAARLQQVFWNLLKNASKFTPEGGSIRLESRREPGRIVVEIADTGIGFEPEAATRIFESFTQANAGITQRFGGLGLGLAISKATMDAHGGTLTARSAGPGQGAAFTVTLPL